MNKIIDTFINMTYAEEFFCICLFIIGLLIGYVIHVIQRWKADRKFNQVEKDTNYWLKHHSIDELADDVQEGKVKLSPAMRTFITNIANEIQTFSEDDDDNEKKEVNENNDVLSSNLIIIGGN